MESNSQTLAAPAWLTVPSDLNALDEKIWPKNCCRVDGVIHLGGIGLDQVAKELSTPIYLLDEDDFLTRARAFSDAFSGWKVCYASKAFLSKTVARWVQEVGLSLDVCSGGELEIALRAGFQASKIGFHGNNKSVAELTRALEVGVERIIVDSNDEIARLKKLSAELGTSANVLVRVTPGVHASTHEYIATAHEDQKFGFSIASGQAMEALLACHEADGINLLGIHCHIGSQIFDTAGFEVAAKRTLCLAREFNDRTGTPIAEVDLGGGFGVAYTSQDTPLPPAELARRLNRVVDTQIDELQIPKPQLSIEPGRSIVGPSGIALYTVGTVKQVHVDGGIRHYVSVDGGMSDNIRPALYGADYTCALANRVSTAKPVLSRVVGKHCEGGDIVVHDVYLPADVTAGDLIAVPNCGAYSRAMASNYNQVPRPGVAAVKDGKIQMLIRSETIADLLSLDVGD